MSYKAVKLVKRPETDITTACFELVELDTPELESGQILIKQTHMSLDPAMRGWMSAATDSYIPPVGLGEVMRSSGVGEVVKSRNDKFPVGAKVAGMFGWREYLVSDGEGVSIMPQELPAEAILSVLALPGVTAYHGLMEVAKPKAGETLLVSGAAGSVGSLVGQIAKAEGLRVIGVAGSQEKCRWLVEELGFDAAINYKTEDLAQAVKEAAPNGIDIYFENTGGPIQHVAMANMNAFGRIVVCGVIADYNAETPAPGPSWTQIVKKRLSIQGFTMPDHMHRFGELSQKVGAYLLAGKIKYRTHELNGLESAIEGINLLFTGANEGKLLVRL
ncbi:NADP-dependent oxidoreductase [Hahella sp. KA22]|uniref:NADP-dependent oxidoreductase n=1 Tax=Hahella sp. KA22 TaxID=1628392 RepID=UPI000FDD2CB8|nr:NADP-dependent oxidoreductase [Hahella sp. KA22]AZZ91928.1 NADP-dependent oxidoreductase [Hahella sp. KA22]QAY55299.1 NADP-dependent oxidoreductase [Hahella sp. KA22]